VLQRELARHPESVPGWYALGLLYHQMEQPRMAVQAARKGLERTDNGAQRTAVRLLLARGLIASAGGELVPEAEEILLDIVERQPRHDGAWTLLAMSASRSDRHGLAERAFQALLERHGEGELGGMLRQGLERVRSARAESGGESAEPGTTDAGPVTVRVTAAQDVAPGGTLFVFLRQGAGGGKPLAARRTSVEAFPVTLTVRRGDWLERPPADRSDLRAGARYSASAGAGVGSAGLRAAPVPLDGDGEGPDAELRLEP
jgi:cytochrome c-type biogenesis protein CcmH